MPLHVATDLLGWADERFRAVWDNTTDAMTLSDADGIVLMANQAYQRLTGYSADEMVGQSAAVIFPPEFQDWMIHHYRELYAMETPPPAGELAIQHADGTARYVEARLDFLMDEGRRVAMITVLRDVTERRRAAELVDKLHALATGMASARQPSEIARLILAHCVSVLGAQAGAVNLISADGTILEMLESIGYPPDVVERWRSMPVAAPTFLSEAVRTARPVFVGSIEALQTRYPGLIVSSVALGHHSWAALPLMGERGPIGAIGVSFVESRELTSDERALAVTLASQCAQRWNAHGWRKVNAARTPLPRRRSRRARNFSA